MTLGCKDLYELSVVLKRATSSVLDANVSILHPNIGNDRLRPFNLVQLPWWFYWSAAARFGDKCGRILILVKFECFSFNIDAIATFYVQGILGQTTIVVDLAVASLYGSQCGLVFAKGERIKSCIEKLKQCRNSLYQSKRLHIYIKYTNATNFHFIILSQIPPAEKQDLKP